MAKPSRSLLETLSFAAQKVFARRKCTFDLVLAILQRADGELTSFEYACRAPESISDREQRGKSRRGRGFFSYLQTELTHRGSESLCRGGFTSLPFLVASKGERERARVLAVLGFCSQVLGPPHITE